MPFNCRFACLCAYIHLNLEPESPPSAWNREKLSDLLHSALSLRQPDLVLSAFRIFLADHLLTHLLNWLDAFGRHEADTGGLEALRDVHSEIPEFFGQRSHVLRMAIQLLSWWMSYVVEDVEQQMDLVAMWADVLPLEALLDHRSLSFRCGSVDLVEFDSGGASVNRFMEFRKFSFENNRVPEAFIRSN